MLSKRWSLGKEFSTFTTLRRFLLHVKSLMFHLQWNLTRIHAACNTTKGCLSNRFRFKRNLSNSWQLKGTFSKMIIVRVTLFWERAVYMCACVVLSTIPAGFPLRYSLFSMLQFLQRWTPDDQALWLSTSFSSHLTLVVSPGKKFTKENVLYAEQGPAYGVLIFNLFLIIEKDHNDLGKRSEEVIGRRRLSSARSWEIYKIPYSEWFWNIQILNYSR